MNITTIAITVFLIACASMFHSCEMYHMKQDIAQLQTTIEQDKTK